MPLKRPEEATREAQYMARGREYFDAELNPPDPLLEETIKASTAAGLPSIQVSAAQGKLLYLLALAGVADRIEVHGQEGGGKAQSRFSGKAPCGILELSLIELHQKEAQSTLLAGVGSASFCYNLRV